MKLLRELPARRRRSRVPFPLAAGLIGFRRSPFRSIPLVWKSRYGCRFAPHYTGGRPPGVRWPGRCWAASYWPRAARPSRNRIPRRTGIEQLLISSAADRALDKIDFGPIRGAKIYVEPKHLDCTDKEYILVALHHRLLAQNCTLVDKPEDADVQMENLLRRRGNRPAGPVRRRPRNSVGSSLADRDSQIDDLQPLEGLRHGQAFGRGLR